MDIETGTVEDESELASEGSPAQEGDRERRRRYLRYAALVASVGLFLGVVHSIGFDEVAEATREADLRYVVVAACFYGLALLTRVFKWYLLVRTLENAPNEQYLAERGHSIGESGRSQGERTFQLGLGRLLQIYLAGGFLDATTPGARVGGEPLKAYYLGQGLGRPKSECLATVVVEKLSNLVVLSFIALVGSAYVLWTVELNTSIRYTLGLLLGLLVAGYLGAIYLIIASRRAGSPRVRAAEPGQESKVIPSQAEQEEDGIITTKIPLEENGPGGENKVAPPNFLTLKIIGLSTWLWARGPLRKRLEPKHGDRETFSSYVLSRVDNFAQSLKTFAHRKDLLNANLLLAGLMWALVFGRTYLLFVGFGSDIYYSEVAVIVTLSILLSYLAFTPGGLGVSEVVLLALYVSFGAEKGIAAAVAVLDRLIYYGFGIGLGYWALRRLEKSPS